MLVGRELYCQRGGTYNDEGFVHCIKCGGGLGPTKDNNRLLWIILLVLIGLPLLTILPSFILYILVMGTG